jgi:hypothetical protein
VSPTFEVGEPRQSGIEHRSRCLFIDAGVVVTDAIEHQTATPLEETRALEQLVAGIHRSCTSYFLRVEPVRKRSHVRHLDPHCIEVNRAPRHRMVDRSSGWAMRARRYGLTERQADAVALEAQASARRRLRRTRRAAG